MEVTFGRMTPFPYVRTTSRPVQGCPLKHAAVSAQRAAVAVYSVRTYVRICIQRTAVLSL